MKKSSIGKVSQPLPLEGIKVIELTGFVFGPHTGVLLADMGAEIIKVEMPGVGDWSRDSGH